MGPGNPPFVASWPADKWQPGTRCWPPQWKPSGGLSPDLWGLTLTQAARAVVQVDPLDPQPPAWETSRPQTHHPLSCSPHSARPKRPQRKDSGFSITLFNGCTAKRTPLPQRLPTCSPRVCATPACGCRPHLHLLSPFFSSTPPRPLARLPRTTNHNKPQTNQVRGVSGEDD